jgi:hypothetical protein
MPDKNNLKEESFIFLMVSVHHGEKGVVDTSHHGGQEAEWSSNRKTCPQWTLPPAQPTFHSYISQSSTQILNPSMG